MTREQQFAQAYSGSGQKIYLLMLRKCHNEDLAQDLAQQAWLQGWEHLADFAGRSTVETWVHRIAINLFLTHLRRPAQRREVQLPPYSQYFGVVPSFDAPLDVQKILTLCDSKTAKVLQERYLEEREFTDIGTGGTNMRGRCLVFKARNAARAAIGIAPLRAAA